MADTRRSSLGVSVVVVCAAVLSSPSLARAELVPLGTAAALSPRPLVCAPESGRVSIWRGAHSAAGSLTTEICSRLAQVRRFIVSDPAAATALSLATQKLVGNDAHWRGPAALRGPWLLSEARVLVANEQAAAAIELFHRAAKLSPISEWDPGALRDYATSAVATGSYIEAVGAYRRLVAVSAWLEQNLRTSVRLEAAFAVLRLERPDVSEALGYLDGLDASDVDAGATRLAGLVEGIAQAMTGAAVTDARPASGTMRKVARLTDIDWRLIESWQAWQETRDVEVWGWTRETAVPASYRALADRCVSGGK